MSRRPAPGEFVVGMALKAVLDRMGVRGGRRTRLAAGRPEARPAEPTPVKPSVRRRPLLLFMLGCLGLGMFLMLIFEHWTTRVVGVVTLFAFIVSGVFLIADPAFLAADDDED